MSHTLILLSSELPWIKRDSATNQKEQGQKYHIYCKQEAMKDGSFIFINSVTNCMGESSLQSVDSHPDNHTRKTSDHNNSLSEDYSHPDDHTRQTTDH